MRILGSAGAIEIRDDHMVTVRRSNGQSEQFSFPAPPGDPLLPGAQGLIAEITQALRDRRQTSPSFDDGVAVAEVLDQLRSEAEAIRTRP
ncbi:hypothetical protein I6A62_07755 [Frankia sp. AgW1.1]|nr:hypothetical protein [Frankia sp. AgW1.1]